MSSGAVFLDRDGTINYEVTYLATVDQLELINGAGQGIHDLNRAGLKTVVITNQSAIARGFLTEETLHNIHDNLHDQLRLHDATLDAIYYCPHHPTAGTPPYRRKCSCRKPNPGMLQQAAEELNIDLTRSYVVGDKVSDLEVGMRAGCKSILVRTGYGSEVEEDLTSLTLQPTYVADDLREAASWILQQQ